jgi:hypothetical protein
VVAIPGEDRLPFFFPEWDIRNSRVPEDLPTTLEDLGDAEIFVNNSAGVFLMQVAGKWPNSLQAEAGVGTAYHQLSVTGGGPDGSAPWPTVLQPIPLNPDGSLPVDDGNFRFTAFTVHPEARSAALRPNAARDDTVIIGGFAQFLGHSLGNTTWARGEKIILALGWRPTESAPPPQDYSIYIHLLDPNGNLKAHWDNVPLQGQYPTRYWRPGESLLDYWVLRIPPDTPPGPAVVKIGIYEPVENKRLPVVIDGEAAGDGLVLPETIEVK